MSMYKIDFSELAYALYLNDTVKLVNVLYFSYQKKIKCNLNTKMN